MKIERGIDARRYMEQAIEVMRNSICESRSDGKKPPKVGAVLVKPDGTTETACRCELRDGDHAEYTLLERKNRNNRLDDCVLFATLEPCAPNSRHAPKLGCAERIVLARIKKVWVGIEDPDPTVDRKGIKYLQDSGVEVHMFDRDLQEIIVSENQEFIDQALERAAEAENYVEEVKLSSLEDVHGTDIEEFDQVVLEKYRVQAGIPDEITSPAFVRRLKTQGLIKEHDGQFSPTGFGQLLFGKEPRIAMPQAGLLATVHYPDGTEEIEDFDGPQVEVPEQALKWLKDKLPNTLDRSTAQRKETNKEVLTLVREAIVNALVHRDYEIAGAKCQLVVESGKIIIKSPGYMVPPTTLDQMSSFNAPMLSRNPVMHYIFAKMKLAEERGLGLKSMKTEAEKTGLPLPRYLWDDPYLVLTIYQSEDAAVTSLPEEAQKRLSEAELRGWSWLTRQGHTKSADYASAMGVDARTARRHLNQFVNLGLIRKVGSGPTTYYQVI
ncbi:MAG: ATP-binding protein [Armatimonadota bacterium]